jgi:hypothetical protein
MRDARREAAERLPGRDPRVLEPSPPAVRDGPWLADDPVAGGDVVPVERAGATTWNDLCASDPELATWCAERWLGGWRRLAALPPGYATTRRSLHAVAEHVLAAVRHRANGKIGLRYTYRGFGTPFFGAADHQVRVEETTLVVDDARSSITTVGNAGVQAGIRAGAPTDVFTPATPLEPDAPLDLDVRAAAALGEWFGFCASVLEQLREEATEGDAPARVQLWPEHFDMAVDLGEQGDAEKQGARANYGGSPGDAEHPEPYLYVGPWVGHNDDPYWNESFGASLGYQQLLGAADQRATALDFLRQGKGLLAGA